MIIFRLTLVMSDSSSEHDIKISLPLNYTQQLGRKMCLLFHIHEKKEIQSFQRVWVSFIRLNQIQSLICTPEISIRMVHTNGKYRT